MLNMAERQQPAVVLLGPNMHADAPQLTSTCSIPVVSLCAHSVNPGMKMFFTLHVCIHEFAQRSAQIDCRVVHHAPLLACVYLFIYNLCIYLFIYLLSLFTSYGHLQRKCAQSHSSTASLIYDVIVPIPD